jgi:hypothetical protein
MLVAEEGTQRYAISLLSVSVLIPVVLVSIDKAGTTRLDAKRRRRGWRMAIILSSNTPPPKNMAKQQLIGVVSTLTMG